MNNYKEFPYLAIVTSSRNDNHGGDMFRRMQIAIRTNIEQLERYKIKSELILVDYNPPPEKPLLKDILLWPNFTKYCTIRTIIVPPSIHMRYKDYDKIPFNGVVAQNTGIRCARAKFVLSTPIDNIFSNEFFELIAKENLKGNRLYRADRCDVSREVLEITSLDKRMEFCRNNILEIATRYGRVPIVRRKKNHLRSRNIVINPYRKKLPSLFCRLHINGPDLILMSRESWNVLNGFPKIETNIINMHSDGFLSYMAYLSGIKEEILPEKCCNYHIEHDSRWRNTQPPLYEKIIFYCFPDMFAIYVRWVFRQINNRLISKIFRNKGNFKLKNIGITPASWTSIWEILQEMKNGKRPIAYNDENWGLGQESLPEYNVLTATWEKK